MKAAKFWEGRKYSFLLIFIAYKVDIFNFDKVLRWLLKKSVEPAQSEYQAEREFSILVDKLYAIFQNRYNLRMTANRLSPNLSLIANIRYIKSYFLVVADLW